MSITTTQKLRRRKRRIQRRLARRGRARQTPMFAASNVHYEVADRTRATTYGGIGAMQQLVGKLRLAEAIDSRLHLLKTHRPYHESDHVMNITYNVMCDGDCLEDLERLRNDEAYLDAVGAERIPDPTTAGDFCRRFTSAEQVDTLMDAINSVRVTVWRQQPEAFFTEAIIDADGTLAPTTGQCKQGMDISYKGDWGYHPLLISLSNTREPLYLLNRPGNRPSHENAAAYLDKAIALCREAGFGSIRLRGDTDFSQTAYLDAWDAQQGVTFLFGMDAVQTLKNQAELLESDQWKQLVRPPRYTVKTTPRVRPQNVKQQVVVDRDFDNLKLLCEHVAEISYRPVKCAKAYRMIICRKTVANSSCQAQLWTDYRYFFFITNDRTSTPEDLVLQANKRADQENLIEQMKNGVHAMKLPVDNLLSNWAYMVMASLAWTLKAWFGLMLPVCNGAPRARHEQQKHEVVRMEFKRFVSNCIRLPAQIVRGGRRLLFRFLNYNPWQSALLRGVVAWRTRAQC